MSSFLFLNPWLLGALLALPALWFLLRIMPPAPKRIFLPSARFLAGLVPQTQTPNKTPWWILLLRILIATFAILAFAQPVLNPSQELRGDHAIRLVIDNGWSSANIWDTKIKSAQDILAQAERQGLSVYITTTAPEASNGKPLDLGPFSAAEALSRVKGLEPLPWPSDFRTLNQNLKDANEAIDSYYLSDGLEGRALDRFINTIDKDGSIHIYAPKAEQLPVILSRDDDYEGNPAFIIRAAETVPAGTPLTLQAQGADGAILGVENINISSAKTDVVMELPDSLRRELASVRVTGRSDAASVYLLGNQFQKKSVGIVSPSTVEEEKPFIEASFYLTRALEPYADLSVGNIDDLLSGSPSMIIMPDIGALAPAQLNKLENWVKDGGLLLRFAGPAMEQARQNFLLPVPLRKGARSLEGALTWETPPKLQEFPKTSPFADIVLREDITIKQQLLAEPSQDLPERTWAMLDDGTPLVTANALESGMIVMVHTTASPDWSNLPLSGVFVQMLSRIVTITGSSPDSLKNISGSLEPLRILDGYGRLTKPDASVQLISAKDVEKVQIGPAHPPGIYGHESAQRTLNIGDFEKVLTPLPDYGPSVKTLTYGLIYETNLMPFFLVTAFVLLLIDWIAMIILSGSFRLQKLKSAMGVLCAVMVMSAPAYADIPEQYKYADGLYLGFIQSDNTAINAQTRQGLGALKDALTRRTSAEPDGVVALDPETDILSFFPLIYWPIDKSDQSLSEQALLNIQDYLDHGGTILFDTRGDTNSAALTRVTAGLNIPALAPIKDDHVLGKSFYLLDSFPGRYPDGVMWIESNSENGRDGVSSVIIGSNDWAYAWAQSAGRDYRAGTAARQREIALRFGVNLVMYALTGNYKADQVHMKHILERLGQ